MLKDAMIDSVYLARGSTDMRNYGNSSIMGSKAFQNPLLHNQSNETLPIIYY